MNHYVILTAGEFDEYDIVQLYGCDHPVDPAEWQQLMYDFNRLVEEENKAIHVRHGGRLGYGHIPQAHQEYLAFVRANHPLPAFVEKHGLVKLDHVNLWTWGQS